MKKETFYILILSMSLFINLAIFSQIHPSIDPNYTLQNHLSDDFNGTDVDSLVWDKMNWSENPHEHIKWGGNSNWKPENISVDTGYLFLRVDAPNEYYGDPNYLTIYECCHTGGLISKDTSYKYGYYESRMKLPGHYKSDGTPTHHKFHPAWWMSNSYHLNGCKLFHSEVDIVEPDPWEWRGHIYPSGMSNNFGSWAKDPSQYCTDSTSDVHKYIDGGNASPTPLFEDFHTYAVEFDSENFTYYFDNVPMGTFSTSVLSEIRHMRMVLGLQIKQADNNNVGLLFDPNAVFPHYFVVDFMHYYKLNYNCNEVSNILTNSSLDNFVYGVKKTINISYSSGNINLNNNQNYVFRATDGVNILGGFSMPVGSELHIIPTICQ